LISQGEIPLTFSLYWSVRTNGTLALWQHRPFLDWLDWFTTSNAISRVLWNI